MYIHVPFCAHRCGYCDFTLVAGKDHLAESYLDALELEMDRTIRSDIPLEVDTIFFGGGTPTQLPEDALARLTQIVRRRFEVSEMLEFSVEANPAGFTNGKLDLLKEAGVNRVSLGIQSFDASVLSTLERDHRRDEIIDCVERIKPRIPDLALDLIFAVPGQSVELWQRTLDAAVAMQPTHLSTYGLTFEKGTAFWSRREKGALQPHDDETEREMYALAMSSLEESGFEQYEISNFAKPGFRCRHNQMYWTGKPFFGFGPGAASLIDGRRALNHRSVTTWLKKTLAGEQAVFEAEVLEPEDRVRELLVLGLRRLEGIKKAELGQIDGIDLGALFGDQLRRLTRRGLLEETGDTIRLTYEGRFFYDSVAGELL